MLSTYCSPLETVLTITISIIKVVLTSDYDNDNNKNVLTVYTREKYLRLEEMPCLNSKLFSDESLRAVL